jgi:hypothetical protein
MYMYAESISYDIVSSCGKCNKIRVITYYNYYGLCKTYISCTDSNSYGLKNYSVITYYNYYEFLERCV